MKLITFKQYLREAAAAASPSGAKITTYFETDQGSKYLLSDKNESKRIKSVHANTGGDDQGVKKWFPHCVFVADKFQYIANAPMFLMNQLGKISNIFISVKGTRVAFYKKVNDKFEICTYDDAYPKSKKGPVPLVFDCSLKPAVGLSVVEWSANANGSLINYHMGSPVSVIKNINDLSDDEVNAFKTPTK